MSGHEHEHDHDRHHHHDAPPNSHLGSNRSPERNEALARRVAKIEALLTEKGLFNKATLDRIVEIYEHDLGPLNGAKVIARAWVDPAYRQRLLDNATAATAELGFGGLQGEHLVVVENTPKVHNVVVCTLCSCYPWPVLGLPPAWYKDAAYRSRVVIDPRGVLADFGTVIDDDVEVRVWDSSAEVRYLVLPQRPAGTETLTEEQLTKMVERDAMIGVRKVAPA